MSHLGQQKREQERRSDAFGVIARAALPPPRAGRIGPPVDPESDPMIPLLVVSEQNATHRVERAGFGRGREVFR